MTNVYQGPGSCYARHGLPYVSGHGVNARTAAAIARIIERELKRGWTFEKGTCRRIKMTPRLAKKRLRYLITLAHRHAPHDVPRVRRIVNKVLNRVRNAYIRSPRRYV